MGNGMIVLPISSPYFEKLVFTDKITKFHLSFQIPEPKMYMSV